MAGLVFYLNLLELMLGPMMLVIAAIVYWASPRSWANRALAVFIFIEGMTFGGVSNGMHGFTTGAVQHGFWQVTAASLMVLPSLYIWFTAEALDHAITRPFRTVPGRLALVAYAVAALVYYFATDPIFMVALPALFITSLYAMVAAWLTWRDSSGMVRRRAMMFLAAFALRDIAVIGIVVGYLVGPGTVFQQHSSFWWSVVYAFFPFMVAFGVLRGQIVDLDERVRLSAGRGTVVTLSVLAFFVLGELAEGPVVDRVASVVTVTWAQPIVGILGAGLVAAAGRPIAAGGRRLAGAFIPAADDAAAFYREQVEIALSDGAMGPKEERALQSVRQRLGIHDSTARRIEAELRPMAT